MGQGQDTRGLLHYELFARVNFPLKSNIYEAFSAAWMQKLIFTGQPDQIIDLIRLPRSREKCKLTITKIPALVDLKYQLSSMA